MSEELIDIQIAALQHTRTLLPHYRNGQDTIVFNYVKQRVAVLPISHDGTLPSTYPSVGELGNITYVIGPNGWELKSII